MIIVKKKKEEELYNKESLTCDKGTKILKKEWINDGYCDCMDGFDEPSTSACSNSQFFCRNEGFESYSIPSQWVNDKICGMYLKKKRI